MTAHYGLYAYGLVAKPPEQLDIVGIDQQNKVYPVEGRDMYVMVSEIDVDVFQSRVKVLFSELSKNAGTAPDGLEALLQAHENVVAALMKNTTVVPYKFGTILRDEQAAVQMLLDDEEKFNHLLSKCSGRAEWGLKIYGDHQEFMERVARTEPEFKTLEEKRETLSKGAAYLFSKKIEQEVKSNAVARLARISESIFHELAQCAYEAKLNKTLPQKLTKKKKEMLLNAVYLVERENTADFCEQGKRLAGKYEAMGLELDVSGPWPPYSFTDR
jgi:Gas vesicle synthesis protein GvpL/GvpF